MPLWMVAFEFMMLELVGIPGASNWAAQIEYVMSTIWNSRSLMKCDKTGTSSNSPYSATDRDSSSMTGIERLPSL